MKVELEIDKTPNKVLSKEGVVDITDENVFKKENEKFEAIDMVEKASSNENNATNTKEEYYDALLRKINDIKCSLKAIEDLNYANVIVEHLLQGKNIEQAKEIWDQYDDKKIELREKLSRLNAQYLMLCRQKIEAENVGKNYKYYCSVCLIIREDNEYLEEWLNWHINQGVEHFYIYDHGSKKPIAETIQELGSEIQSRVTLTDFSGLHVFAQHEAYNDCLKNYGEESRWIAFIDSDEMIRVKNGMKLTEFLKSYEEFAGLFMTWITYGANGHKYKTNEPLRERFTAVSPSNSAENIGKVIVQPAYMKTMHTHNGNTKDGFIVVDEHKEPVDDAQIFKVEATTDLICVDHYYTKSYEEWLNKIRRGSCDPYYSRKYDEFFEYNPDMAYCRENIFPIQEYEISKI